MKKNVLAIIVVMFIGGQIFAQEAKCNHCKKQDRAQQKTEMMVKELGLDENQQAKVLELNKNFESKLQSALCNEEKTATKNCSKDKEQKEENCCKKKTENMSNCCKENQPEKMEKCGMLPNEGQQRPPKVCPKKMKQLNEEYMKELETILNTDQLSKLKNKQSKCCPDKPGNKKCNK